MVSHSIFKIYFFNRTIIHDCNFNCSPATAHRDTSIPFKTISETFYANLKGNNRNCNSGCCSKYVCVYVCMYSFQNFGNVGFCWVVFRLPDWTAAVSEKDLEIASGRLFRCLLSIRWQRLKRADDVNGKRKWWLLSSNKLRGLILNVLAERGIKGCKY